ncbi:hypothetical protein CBR_g575 [Chara braunii]|uniref:Uncharacterized protein n=1 Tax=Chara braunii TaxID=69332 RepID=A0A388KBL8_CHABU|nr:hypothetical protein CBR_g575 [Chara braunii]|eukprot:GBG67440.1 hypothetical protein CBR_g575 [Chara braunii]
MLNQCLKRVVSRLTRAGPPQKAALTGQVIGLGRAAVVGSILGAFKFREGQARQMASNVEPPPKHLPAQKQEAQPGVEHVMTPRPRAERPGYQPGNKLEGKVALITGGDSGIGRAVVHQFALEGMKGIAFTYLSPREDKDAQETVEIAEKAFSQRQQAATGSKDPGNGGKCIKIPAELGADENCKKVVDEVVKAFGKIDVLVNNAAEQHYHDSLEEITPEEWERTFRTNIHSYFYLTRHALPHIPEGGSIINTTSVNAYKGHPTLIPYTATKGAIVGFTRSLAMSLVSKGIRVNGVAPGPVWTPLIPSSAPEPKKVEGFGENAPMGRVGHPDEIAPSYVFLASEIDSSYITGQVLHPNGGYVLNT